MPPDHPRASLEDLEPVPASVTIASWTIGAIGLTALASVPFRVANIVRRDYSWSDVGLVGSLVVGVLLLGLWAVLRVLLVIAARLAIIGKWIRERESQ